MRLFDVPVVVGINKFISDTDEEIATLRKLCEDYGVEVALNNCWAEGGKGGVEMGEKVLKLLQQPKTPYKPLYDVNDSIPRRWKPSSRKSTAATASSSKATPETDQRIGSFWPRQMPICVAKTQYSLSDNPALLGAPKGFKVTVKDVRVCTGAGFIVCQTSNIMTMPGLPKVPAANRMDIDENGVITGLF